MRPVTCKSMLPDLQSWSLACVPSWGEVGGQDSLVRIS